MTCPTVIRVTTGTCPTVIQVTTGTGPPGIGLPAGTADAGKFVRKAGSTPYAYELVSQEQVSASLFERLDAFRDAATFYVSKRITASDSNNGTSDGEPFLTIGAAVTAAKAYVTANPGKYARIAVGPGQFTESGLPFRTGPRVYAHGDSQRTTIIKPASGEELNGFWALDSDCLLQAFRFTGHQATGTSSTNSAVGTRAWAVQFDAQANGGQGPIIYASPYIKDCTSVAAEQDSGVAGSVSLGDTGGGVEIDGARCHPNSPVKSMVVDGYTQQNLGGPGVVIKNDAYAELVSCFGIFCTWHVQAESGGWATMSGGGCSEFGTYGVVADGYSPSALFTGSLRTAAAAGSLSIDVVGLTTNRIGRSNRPHSGQVLILGGTIYAVTSSSPINSSGTVVTDADPNRAGYRVEIVNPFGIGLAAAASQGAAVDFRRRSQVSAGCHTALYVGSGTNYNALPWNGGVPVRANQFVERNFGKVFGLCVNDAGDIYAAGGAFQIDGASGAVTINTSQFNLSGLNSIGPFSRNGGVSTVGVRIDEASNDVTLLSSLGTSDGNTVPTQFAVRRYSDNRYLTNLTSTSGQPIAIADTSTQDAAGYWTRSRNVSLTLNAPGGLVQLNSSGQVPAALLPGYVDDVLEFANLTAFPVTGESGKIYVSLATNLTYRWSGTTYVETSASPGSTDAVPEGVINQYFTAARAIGSALTDFSASAGTVSATDSILQAINKIVYNISNLLVKSSNLSDLSNVAAARSNLGLGTAAQSATSEFLLATFSASAISYAATVTLDMSALTGGYRTIALTGDLTLATTNRASGRQVTVRLSCDATQRALTFPASWVFIGAKPATIAASKSAVLSLTYFGTADADCIVAYGVQA